ncbi:MAG: hypothetical protein BWY39_01702 [Spirochaetes bacterium ADurb.Bin269]|nr:MAG: hypothetical protein BWY39_01702 [Spirochaetes bacterium ADurb.Bin269]
MRKPNRCNRNAPNIVKSGCLCYYTVMIGFFIKKAFYDGWDNLLSILVMNVAILAVAFGGWFLAGATLFFLPLSIFMLVLSAAAEGVLFLTISALMAKVSKYESFSASDIGEAFGASWKHGALFGLLIAAIVFVASVAFPYYFSLGNMIGLALSIVIFWVTVVVALSLQWFLPIRSQLDTNFVKCLKKSFIIFFDNPGFSLFMFLYSLVLTVLSLVMVMLMPGFAGMILAHNNAFRLRMYKYDWLEEHPELDVREARKSVPWAELLSEDEDTVGHRTLKSFIFPWKD